MDFVRSVINEHQNSDLYKSAKVADEYARHQNRTIMQYQKMLYTLSGAAVTDNWSANYKVPSNFFYRFITQETQFLLGNGVSWENEATGQKLGADFDHKLQQAGTDALIGGVSFGFFNLDHLETFSVLEFAPLYDEENGALAAGVRFWQIDSSKPLRATLYESDGYTDYIWKSGEGSILNPKRTYKLNIRYTEADGMEIYDGENYPTFPIVPLWANPYHQSEFTGMQASIDAYDFVKSGFANELDEAQVFWTISGAGGMDDIDLAEFRQRIKMAHAAAVGDGQTVEAHTLSLPYDARETLLDRLRKDMYRDYMALDTEEIAAGAVTATQIKAAYEPLNNKADQFEYCVIDFVQGILNIAGIEDNPTFTRSMIVNRAEEITNLVQAGEYLPEDYVTEKIIALLGDIDRTEELLNELSEDETERGLIPEIPEEGEMIGEEARPGA